MSKEIYISSTPHETRLAIVENDALTEMYYERENEYTLAGSIYNGRVTRVLPGMQSSFVDIGLERDAFLYITDFMEEAGDAADFETTHGGSGEPRGPRTDGQRGGRNGQQDRGDRPAPTVIEGSVAAPDAQREGARNEGRSEGGRSDRGGRNRRGRGDRGRGEMNGRSDNNSPNTGQDRPLEASRPVEANGFNTPDFNTAEIGEGAPGADGSRRWRGRRGRRRGRGPVGSSTEASALAQPADSSLQEANRDYAYTEDDFAGYSHEIDGAAAPDVEPEAMPANATASDAPEADRTPYEAGEPGAREGSRSRDRNRGRDRGRERGRDGRGDSQAPRAPRGFSPSRESYGADADAASTDSFAPAEAIVLPGESLSKYRHGSEPEASQSEASSSSGSLSANVIVPKPANVIDDEVIATGWDGGSVLPGETLSRRSRPEQTGGRPNERHDQRRDNDRSSRNAGRDRNPGERKGGYAEQRSQPSTQPMVVPSFAAPVAETIEPQYASPAEPSVTAEPVAAIETEYEPHEASASYRVDPVAPSEFRQSAPVIEEVEPEVEEEVLVEAAAAHEPLADAHSSSHEPVFDSFEESSVAPEAITPQLDTTGVPPPPPPFLQLEQQPEPAAADITTISEAGAMHSETPTEPVATTAGHEASHGEDQPSLANTLHAAYDEEYEDLEEIEEETLEGAADLGTMLREMSIDEITRPGDLEEAEEDEDFEEEESEFTGEVDDLDEVEVGDSFEESEEADGDKPTHQTDADAAFFANTFREPSSDSEGQTGVHGGQTDRSGRPGSNGRPDRNGRRSGRRDGRRDGRSDRSGGERSRSTGGEHDRPRTGGRSRQSAQLTNLPAISDLLKPGQEILVQIAKEPIAKKGARITSHIALPGRFLVFMPTVNHTGVSRKIESDHERRRLKEILLSEKGEASGGFIVRTAAAGASEEELRSDLRFLLNLWTDIKTRSESSKSPALIYHDLNLVERILRDQVTDNFSAIWVDTESEYERVLRFLQRFQPGLIRRVKLYTKETPLFEQFGITEEINKALRSKVWLKSGGSIVINQTEALVAIDINTGKFVGKTARLEDTIVKTNLDAIPEIVRQIRLRDLGGIIIIDFIDMDERKNRNRVMAALEEELKSDRAPSKVLQFNDFGLVAITRKRVKQSLERTLSTTCGVCQGTGMVKSPITVCNDIYIEMRKMHKHLDRGDVMLRVHPEVVKQLKSGTSKWLQEMEEMVGKTILVKSDPSLHPEQFDIH